MAHYRLYYRIKVVKTSLDHLQNNNTYQAVSNLPFALRIANWGRSILSSSQWDVILYELLEQKYFLSNKIIQDYWVLLLKSSIREQKWLFLVLPGRMYNIVVTAVFQTEIILH